MYLLPLARGHADLSDAHCLDHLRGRGGRVSQRGELSGGLKGLYVNPLLCALPVLHEGRSTFHRK